MCLLATSIYRKKIKLRTVLLLTSLYQEGTVLLTFLWGWLKVVLEIFPEKEEKKRRVVAQEGKMNVENRAFEMAPEGGLHGMSWLPHHPAPRCRVCPRDLRLRRRCTGMEQGAPHRWGQG